jgi:hypothetical protein
MGFSILVGVTGLFSCGVAVQGNSSVPTSQSVTVELTCGSHVALGSGSSAILYKGAQALVQSSESNSRLAGWHFPVSEVQEEFRGAIASNHLRVTFATVRTIESAGGPLPVREIIIRLGLEATHEPFADHFVDSLFTVDDKGKVVGHALYSGVRMIQIWRAVRDATGGTDECKVPKDLPGFS